jgi:ADP-heptose:LPS heptosyltransferase
MALSQPRLVMLRALGLGDLCTGVPAMRAVAAAFPDHARILAAPAWQAPIARQCGVSSIVHTDGLAPLSSDLKGVELAIDLHGCGPESIGLLDDLWPACLVSFRHDSVARSYRGPDWDPAEHEIDRWCRLLTHFGIAADRNDLQLRYSRDVLPDGVDGSIVVHPGAAAPGRRWPAARFARVIEVLLDAGHRVVLTGSPAERTLCGRIHELVTEPVPDRARQLLDLSGKTDLEQLCALVGSGQALLSNDTGVSHLATAFGVASVTLFGPTSPAVWGPPEHPRHRAIWKGRTGDPHTSALDPGLAAIGVEEVLEAVGAVLRVGSETGPNARSDARGCWSEPSGT